VRRERAPILRGFRRSCGAADPCGVVSDGEEPGIEPAAGIIAADLARHVEPGLLEQVVGGAGSRTSGASSGRDDAGTGPRPKPGRRSRGAAAERSRRFRHGMSSKWAAWSIITALGYTCQEGKKTHASGRDPRLSDRAGKPYWAFRRRRYAVDWLRWSSRHCGGNCRRRRTGARVPARNAGGAPEIEIVASAPTGSRR